MNGIVSLFTDKHREQSHEYVDLLYKLAKMSDSSAQDRIYRVEAMTEAYFSTFGKHLDSVVLGRLASLILYDELTDPHPDKMTLEDYPILSDSQRVEREKKEFSEKLMQDFSVDYVDHRIKTRDGNRKIRELLGLYN